MIFQGIEICCPHCRGDLREVDRQAEELVCVSCDRRYPVLLGIPDLRVFSDPYIAVVADRAKGLQIADRLGDLSFLELVDYYYSITPVVPPRHARQYTRGLMAGVARAEAALTSWEDAAGMTDQPVAFPQQDGGSMTGSFLDVGCGTAPLLVAAARARGLDKLVGVDIAFRWLAVAKKRLSEEGLVVPLICACAEALPFPDGAFDRIALDSVLEHVQDQRAVLNECYRALGSGGHLFVSTPNRYSLGPDPHAGILAGGFLPDAWVAAYVRRQGGIPPKRHLLSIRSLGALIRQAGFHSLHIFLPGITPGQRSHFGPFARFLIDMYHVAIHIPISRQVLHWIGPLLRAVSQKPSAKAMAAPVRHSSSRIRGSLTNGGECAT